MQGTIADVKPHQGYGFIRGEDGREYFFHRSALQNCRLEELQHLEVVTFAALEGEKGPRAEDVYV